MPQTSSPVRFFSGKSTAVDDLSDFVVMLRPGILLVRDTTEGHFWQLLKFAKTSPNYCF
jgi:hypothetical protein